MKISELMTKNVETIGPGQPLVEAAQRLAQRDVGPLPVMEGDSLVGFVTDRDIVVRAIAESRDPATTSVSEVMSEPAVTCYADEDAQMAARLMQEKQIKRLPVLDRKERLVGIVALADIAGKTDVETAGKTTKEISEDR